MFFGVLFKLREVERSQESIQKRMIEERQECILWSFVDNIAPNHSFFSSKVTTDVTPLLTQFFFNKASSMTKHATINTLPNMFAKEDLNEYAGRFKRTLFLLFRKYLIEQH